MVKDIENRRWIKAKLSISCVSQALIKNKNWMKEYAEEIGWIVETDKEGVIDENGLRYYEVKVIPNKDGLVSPEELRVIIDKLKGFAQEIFLTLYPDSKKIFIYNTPIKLLTAEKPEDSTMLFQYSDILILEYKILDRKKLEDESPNLAKFIFENTLEDVFNKSMNLKTSFYHRVIEGKEKIMNKQAYKERLKDWFNIKIK